MARQQDINRVLVVVNDQDADRSPTSPQGLSVGEFLENWLWGKQALRPSTHAAYEIHIRRHLKPALGSYPLDRLEPVHIEEMYRGYLTATTVGPTLSVATVRRVHATLMSALTTAVRRGLIERNPAATVELPRVARTSMRSWTAKELGRFLSETGEEPLHMMFLILGLVGLRRGEVTALRWMDVDLNAGLLRVEQSTVRVGNAVHTGPPKSQAGRRIIAVDDETNRRLHWHRCRQQLDVLRATGQHRQPELVFTTAEGAALDPAYVSRLFARLITTHGLPPIRLHDLRHTSASIGLASGESLVEVSRRLGHSSITITADIYSHFSPEVARTSAERLADTVYRS